MAIESATKRMTSAEVVALNRAHTFFSWSIQGALDPIAIDHAEGCISTHLKASGSSTSTAS